MLKIYIDDSGKSDQSPVLVLAGYLAHQERWERLNKQWRSILSAHGMRTFHATEAWRLARNSGLKSPVRRGGAFVQLMDCITTHVEHAFGVSFPLESHEYWFAAKQHPELSSLRAYNMAFYGLMTQIHQHMFRMRFDQELEITFDEQGGESATRVLSGMEEFRRLAGTGFPGLRISTPIFMSDDNCPGLQAADLLAWLLRRDALNAHRQIDRAKTLESLMLGEALSMPHNIKIWSDADLRLAAERVAKQIGTP